MSKIISAGMRIGYLTAPTIFVERMLLLMEASMVHASNTSQAIIYNIIKEWGYDGFVKNAEKVGNFYKKQCELLTSALEKYLTGLATWNQPKSGS